MIGYIMTSALDSLTQTGACYAGMYSILLDSERPQLPCYPSRCVLPFVGDIHPILSRARLAQQHQGG